MEARTRLLTRIAAHAAAGRTDALGPLYAAAVEAGIPVADLQEATLQVFLFAGYPRAIDAFGALADVLGPDAPAPPGEGGAGGDLLARGRSVFARIYGPKATAVTAMLERLHPDFARFTLHDAYGQVLGRPFLPLAERELLAVAMLGALGLRPQLRAHVHGALRVGASPEAVGWAVDGAVEAGADADEVRGRVARALDSFAE